MVSDLGRFKHDFMEVRFFEVNMNLIHFKFGRPHEK